MKILEFGDTSKRKIILIHGFQCPWQVWNKYIEYYKDKFIGKKVIKDISGVTSSEIAPAFGQPGGGIQFELPNNISYLLKNGFLKEIFL